ncbi:MAG: hypothetical protein AB1609_15380 [Bacillota bacterium]
MRRLGARTAFLAACGFVAVVFLARAYSLISAARQLGLQREKLLLRLGELRGPGAPDLSKRAVELYRERLSRPEIPVVDDIDAAFVLRELGKRAAASGVTLQRVSILDGPQSPPDRGAAAVPQQAGTPGEKLPEAGTNRAEKPAARVDAALVDRPAPGRTRASFEVRCAGTLRALSEFVSSVERGLGVPDGSHGGTVATQGASFPVIIEVSRISLIPGAKGATAPAGTKGQRVEAGGELVYQLTAVAYVHAVLPPPSDPEGGAVSVGRDRGFQASSSTPPGAGGSPGRGPTMLGP